VETLQLQTGYKFHSRYLYPMAIVEYLEAVVIVARGCSGRDDRCCGVMVPSRKHTGSACFAHVRMASVIHMSFSKRQSLEVLTTVVESIQYITEQHNPPRCTFNRLLTDTLLKPFWVLVRTSPFRNRKTN
jgi:hypothetical protein